MVGASMGLEEDMWTFPRERGWERVNAIAEKDFGSEERVSNEQSRYEPDASVGEVR